MNPTSQQPLSASEVALRERLLANAEPVKPLSWQELSQRQAVAGAISQPRRAKRAALWLTPFAVAAAVAWLMVIQPLSMTTPATPHTPMLLAGNYQLDHIDQQIQQAYLRGADDATIAALWQRREMLAAQETF